MSDFQIPSHIPPRLVVDYDRFAAPQLKHAPHHSITTYFRTLPPIFYTPRNGGHWVVARTAEAVDMLRRYDIFSSNPALNSYMQRKPRTSPNQYDPPEHTDLRKIINPFFTGTAVEKMEPEIRKLARNLIDDVRPRGQCEFLSEIGKRFPVDIFLVMAGAPLSLRQDYVDSVDRFTHEPLLEDRLQALIDLAESLKGLVSQREDQPRDDLLSAVAHGKMSGRPLTPDEKMGLATLLFLGGLDTVAAMLSFIMSFLARHPAHYRRLIEEPSIMPRAVEELMRAHGVAQMERAVAKDAVYNEITFKTGDRLLFIPQIYGFFDDNVENPFIVDFDRKMSPQYVFGAGPHRCVGSNLARVEISVFLEEWTRTFPSFSIEGDEEPPTSSGIVWSPTAVPLRWPVT